MSRTGSRAYGLYARALRIAVIAALAVAMVPLGAPAVMAQSVTADTYWVDGEIGVDAPGRGSEAEPFDTITYAAAVADALDTIMVRPGTYSSTKGETWPILFDGETIRGTGGALSTTIQGDLNATLFRFDNWTEGDALSGFTIRDGGLSTGDAAVKVMLSAPASAATAPSVTDCVFSSNVGHFGGGLLIWSAAGTNILVSGNTFNGCSSYCGGGLYAQGTGDLLITGNTFSANTARYGGAIDVYTESPGIVRIENNVFAGNNVIETGGAVLLESVWRTANHTLYGNDFSANRATQHGGCVYFRNITVAVERNTAGANEAVIQGGFAYLEDASIIARTNYLVQNRAGFNGAAWLVDVTSSLRESYDTVLANEGCPFATFADPGGDLWVTNSIYWSEGAISEIYYADELAYTCSADDLATLQFAGSIVGAGMVYADPQMDGANLPAVLATSPCVDAGSSAVPLGLDYFGNVRPRGPAPDIGCYEMPQSAPLSVWRFFRPSTGTHFYTADQAEMQSVKNILSGTYAFEGVSYTLDCWSNATPLYRFFRRSTGTHFYTADESEMLNIRSTLGGTYAFEGVSYNVSSGDQGGMKPAVYRFFKPSSGTHFYTADPAERDNVIASLSHIYQYEGPAFWVGQ